MIIAMFLAHLFGDYILQWDSLALWKSRALKGVLLHSAIVLLVTWLFSLPFHPNWWAGVLFISLTHLLIDAAPLYIKLPLPPLGRFILDQIAHFTVIIMALAIGGYLELSSMTNSFLLSLHSDRLLAYLLGYAFITMPAWVLLKFTVYGLVQGSGPTFIGGANKYVSILERLLITTFVALGQFLLVPLVTVPRFVWEWPRVASSDRASVYIAELLGSVTLAVAIGVGLSWL